MIMTVTAVDPSRYGLILERAVSPWAPQGRTLVSALKR
jgi:hypothetical protein